MGCNFRAWERKRWDSPGLCTSEEVRGRKLSWVQGKRGVSMSDPLGDTNCVGNNTSTCLRVLPLPVGFYETGGRFLAGACFTARTPFGWVGSTAAVPRPPPAPAPAARPIRPQLLLPVLACVCLCLSCPSCLFLLLLSGPACPARTSPLCPLGLGTQQPLKLALLMSGRELIYIYWGLHPLAADPFHL